MATAPAPTNTVPVIPLDPTKWAEPINKGIGRITVCRFSDTDQAMGRPGSENEGMTFTEMRGWPRAGATWELNIERLDAVYRNKETGETSPMTRYQTIDLERYNEREHKMVTVMQGNNKAKFIIDKCLAAHMGFGAGGIHPEINVGMVVEFETLASKNFGGPNPAKNLLYVTKILAKPGEEYEYRGEVEAIDFDPNKESNMSLDDAAGGISLPNADAPAPSSNGSRPKTGATPAAAPKAATLDKAGVLALLAGVAYDPDDVDFSDFVTENKAALDAKTKTALLTGAFVTEALEADELSIVDGALVVA